MVVCGIYAISLKNDLRVYIGSSVNIYSRWNGHKCLLRRNKHHSPILQAAWNKYGESAFIFSVLEECDSSQLINREQFYLDKHPSKFNCLPATASRLGCKATEETRSKISLASSRRRASPETRMRMSFAQLGKKMSLESIEKTRRACIGRKVSDESKMKMRLAKLGGKLSLEHKRKISDSLKGRMGVKKDPSKLLPIVHGTRSGYNLELSRGMVTCPLCRAAAADHVRAISAKKKLALVKT